MTTATLERVTRPTVYPTIGIDPGQRWIGLAARIDGCCLDATTLDRGPLPADNEDHYLGAEEPELATRLVDTIDTMMNRHLDQAVEASRAWRATWSATPWRVAVEGLVVRRAKGHGRRYPLSHRLAMLSSLVEVAAVFGEVVATFPGVVVVRPSLLGDRDHARHGDVLARLGPYPSELNRVRPVRFMRADSNKGREHERAAWAVAGAAQLARPLMLAEERDTA